jgi:pectin lyase
MSVVMHTILARTPVLIESHYFDNADTPTTSDSYQRRSNLEHTATVASTARGDCTSDLGHVCEWNRASGSGTWPDLEDTAVLSAFEIYKRSLIGHTGVSNVPSNVTTNAGIEKL